jgi:hypothetical protein
MKLGGHIFLSGVNQSVLPSGAAGVRTPPLWSRIGRAFSWQSICKHTKEEEGSEGGESPSEATTEGSGGILPRKVRFPFSRRLGEASPGDMGQLRHNGDERFTGRMRCPTLILT